MIKKAYLCIDLKSFYASVECVERGLDPMKANLVVADSERTDKTICLAVSVNMKKLGVETDAGSLKFPKALIISSLHRECRNISTTPVRSMIYIWITFPRTTSMSIPLMSVLLI